MFVSIYSMFTDSSGKEQVIATSDFKAMLRKPDEVAKIESITIQPRPYDQAVYIITYKATGTKSIVYGDYKDSTIKLIDDSKVPVGPVKAKDDSSIWPQILLSWLPMIFLFGIFFFFMRQLQAG